MNVLPHSHTFVIPAFGEPQWLERCLVSIRDQTTRSTILVTTSTPNDYVHDIARRHGVPVIVNHVSEGIASDWNFAYRQAASDWVTLAHQDDTYARCYLERCLSAARRVRNPILVFTAAHESFGDGRGLAVNVRFKRAIAAAAFAGRASIAGGVSKRLLLSLGNPVPCPSVMLNKAFLPDFTFPQGWKSNLDWRAWLDLARRPGAFVYLREPLVQRVLHAEAATTRELAARAEEDGRMFVELWPWPVAQALTAFYARSRHQYRGLRGDPPSCEGTGAH